MTKLKTFVTSVSTTYDYHFITCLDMLSVLDLPAEHLSLPALSVSHYSYDLWPEQFKTPGLRKKVFIHVLKMNQCSYTALTSPAFVSLALSFCAQFLCNLCTSVHIKGLVGRTMWIICPQQVYAEVRIIRVTSHGSTFGKRKICT